MKIDFEFETQYGKFADALYFEDDAIPSEVEIDLLKQERLDGWIAIVTAPPVPSAPKPKYQRDESGNLVLDENGDPVLAEV